MQSTFGAYGVYPRAAQLQEVVVALNQGGFLNEEICLLLAPGHPIATEVYDLRHQGRVTESVGLESLVGWLTGLGAVVISNLFFFVRSGKFLHAFAEQQDSGLRGHRGALAGLGISASEVGRLGTRISNGGGLIYVNCDRTAQTQPAIEILRKAGAEEAQYLC